MNRFHNSIQTSYSLSITMPISQQYLYHNIRSIDSNSGRREILMVVLEVEVYQ